jgi:ferredoxin
MLTLRHFHLGAPFAMDMLAAAGADCLPAILERFRDTARLRYEYPLVINPPDPANNQQVVSQLARPLSTFLRDAVDAFAPEDQAARILKDNLAWAERWLRQVLREYEAPLEAAPMLADTGRALQHQLELGEEDRARLQADLDRLLEATPPGTELLGYGRYAAIHLLTHAIRSRVVPRRARFRQQIEKCTRGLKTLLQVDRAKSEEAVGPDMARDGMGQGSEYFDSQALSTVMDHTHGTKRMSQERRQRMEEALRVLEEWREDPVLVRYVHLNKLTLGWLDATPDLAAVVDPDPCAMATTIFDRHAAKHAEVFAAVRIAQLEIAGIYDATIHDPWLACFDWEAFSQEELLLVPAVIAVESADTVAGAGLRSFSRLLSSGRPVHILVRTQAHNNPGALPDEDPFASYRTEIGYLGISHRQAVVTQSSTARHEHLLHSFLAALDATRTSLHVINTGLRPLSDLVPLNAWLVAGAGIESRAHPFFRIDPEAGDVSAARMDFEGNPQPERDWPVHPFRYRNEQNEVVETQLGFSFADYALLIDRLQNHFRVIPPECESDALVAVDAYLSRDPTETEELVPFVWAVDGSSTLHRLVISRALILACRDRQNYWRALQELAGVRNRHVELAVQRTREAERARAAEEHARIEVEHAEALERVRAQAAGEAMRRLTDVLLGIDLSAAVTSAVPGDCTPPSEPQERMTLDAPAQTEEATLAEPEPEPESEQEPDGFDEPWIDTPLCTSCNDCTDLNPALFVYNDNQQAVFGDLQAATYADLVQAAEICPARCIHPGKPLNPDEPGLETLIERAGPFNQ